jgi:hypothetical protein
LKDSAQAIVEERSVAAAFQQSPVVAAAHQLYYAPDIELRQILQARLLARQSDEEIASRASMDPEVVAAYHDTFFDTRSRLDWKLWITKAVLGLSAYGTPDKKGAITERQRGMLYMWFGHHGGPLVLDALISGIGSVPMPQQAHELVPWFDEALEQLVRTRATAVAALLEPNSRNAVQLIKMGLRQMAAKARKKEKDKRPPISEDYLQKIVSSVEASLPQKFVNVDDPLGAAPGRRTGPVH